MALRLDAFTASLVISCVLLGASVQGGLAESTEQRSEQAENWEKSRQHMERFLWGKELHRQETASQSFPRVSELMKKPVKGQEGEALGVIDDVVLGQFGCVQYVVVKHDGKLTPVPREAADIHYSGNELVMNITKQKLNNAPSFSEGSWPNFGQPGYAGEIYSYYGLH